MLLNVAGCEFAAELPEFRRRNFAFAAEFLFDLGFDGKAVAIPSRDVRGVVACHTLGFDDQVFQNFVQPGAEMDRARGIGRTVVKDEKRFAFTRIENLLIQIDFLPSLQLFRLVQRQTGLHGKISFGKIEGFLQFEWF